MNSPNDLICMCFILGGMIPGLFIISLYLLLGLEEEFTDRSEDKKTVIGFLSMSFIPYINIIMFAILGSLYFISNYKKYFNNKGEKENV